MDFFLPFAVQKSQTQITYGRKIMMVGSCFTEEIGNRLQQLKFDILQNPNGILYDPISIAFAIDSYVTQKKYTEADIWERQEIFHSWHHHSAFSGVNRRDVLQQINSSQEMAAGYIKDADWLFITLGSAYHYVFRKDGIPVANCHKVPAGEFEKALCPIEKAESELTDAIKKVLAVNDHCNIVLTVSPVRHIRDGIVENNRSKARLIETCQRLVDTFSSVTYFPAYELVIDVLRDYRFFKSDFVHINEAGTEFVFHTFCNAYMSEETLSLTREIKSLQQAVAHKPFYPGSQAHKNFLKYQLQQAKKLQADFDEVDLSEEIAYFQHGAS